MRRGYDTNIDDIEMKQNDGSKRNGKNHNPDRDVLINKKIFEHDRRKRYGGRLNLLLLTLASVLLGTVMVITVGLLQQNEYDAYINDRFSYINDTLGFCRVVDFKNFDALSTPIAAFLLIIFIILYQRRSFLRKKCSFSYIGLPMIVSCFNKTDRIYTGIVYGRIAFEVFNILYDTFNGTASTVTVEGDPTGLFKLLMRIIAVFLIGFRYYPILVAYRVKSAILYLLSAIYMWIDFGSTVYQTSICDGISSQDSMDIDTALFVHNYWIAYKVLMAIPTMFFSAFISVSLTYRSFVGFIDSKRRSSDTKGCCCDLIKLKDNDEIIYSQYDIDYVLDLFKKKPKDDDDESSNNDKNQTTKTLNLFTRMLHRNDKVETKQTNKPKPKLAEKIKKKIKSLFKKHIYDWNPSFRFSTRIVATHVVALVALYYFFLFFLYEVLTIVLSLVRILPDNFRIDNPKINLGELLCMFSEDICISGLEKIRFTLPIPKSVIKFVPEIKSSIIAVFIAPMFVALLICVVQLLFSLRDTKNHLTQLYKGECDYVPRRKLLSNPSIASSSFHYGGYVVGYLIWGYLIQYCFIVLIGVVIIFLRMFIGDKIFVKFLLKLVPIICGFVVKKIVNVIASRFAFLNRKSKLLALDNFRAYNVFLYFSFFFDCFMGVVSAFIRIIRSAIFNMFMMPRISYGFLGRHLERSDNGYGTYVGFLYMEATHTNPVLVTFCSLLFYRGLSEHIKEELRKNAEKKPHKFRGLIKEKTLLRGPVARKQYKKHVVNKWHVMTMLIKNPALVLYRKQKALPN